MPVVQIHCPQCQSDFVDSRAEWKAEDVARCPKCGTEVVARPIQVDEHESARGVTVHAEPVVAAPLDH